MSKNLNYNTDPIKHYVRYHGWIAPYKAILNYTERQRKKKNREDRCKYLTFCAVQAIDVFMLEMEELLHRDLDSLRLNQVYFCENDLESFNMIRQLIGSDGQGFFGDFQKIILQDIDSDNFESSEEDDPMDEPDGEEEREILRLKDVKRSLLSTFPFDVINLDIYGNFFPRRGDRFSDSCKMYREILKLQKKYSDSNFTRFLMYITVYTPIVEGDLHDEAMAEMLRTLHGNLGYNEFRSAFEQRFGHVNPNDIDYHLKFILGFTKQIIFKESYLNGWMPKVKDIYCYDRTRTESNDYKMATFIVEYKKSEMNNEDFGGSIPLSFQSDYLNQLRPIVLDKPIEVPSFENIQNEVHDHLEKVIEFRNNFLRRIGLNEDVIQNHFS